MTTHVVAPAPKRSSVLITAAVGASATLLVAAVDPNQGGHYPGCPLLALTGLYCPFCGGLRAVHDLTHLDAAGALARNPLVVIAVPLVAIGWLLWAQRAFAGRRLFRGRLPSWSGTALLALLLAFGVLRNIPGWSWLSPA